MFLPKNPVIKLIIINILLIVFTTTTILFVKNKIENKALELQQKRSMLEVSEKHDANFVELKNTYQIVENNLKNVKEMIPNEKNIENFVIALENTATQTNNTQTLTFDPIDKSKSVGKKTVSLNFSTNLTGNIDSFSNYLDKIKTLPYFIEIENITIKNGSGIINNETTMTLKSKVYISK